MASDRTTGGPIHLVQVTRHQQLLEQYDEYLPVARRLQSELLETIDQLREIQVASGGSGEEGGVSSLPWDERAVLGSRVWAEDMGVPWRALRVSCHLGIWYPRLCFTTTNSFSLQRARFRQDKASELLLTSLTARTTQALHSALPPHIQSYIHQSPSPPIYTILPPQWYSDRVDRPTGVLTLRHIRRDIPSRAGDAGKEGIREFAWWIAELTRRCMQDWYEGEFRDGAARDAGNVAGGGCVLVVDAKDAGIKNLVSAIYLIDGKAFTHTRTFLSLSSGTRASSQPDFHQPQQLSITILYRLRRQSLMDAFRALGLHQTGAATERSGEDCVSQGRARACRCF